MNNNTLSPKEQLIELFSRLVTTGSDSDISLNAAIARFLLENKHYLIEDLYKKFPVLTSIYYKHHAAFVGKCSRCSQLINVGSPFFGLNQSEEDKQRGVKKSRWCFKCATVFEKQCESYSKFNGGK